MVAAIVGAIWVTGYECRKQDKAQKSESKDCEAKSESESSLQVHSQSFNILLAT